MEHQEFIYELAIRSGAHNGRKSENNRPQIDLRKLAVEEKGKSYKLMSSCGIARAYIKKSEMLKIFEQLNKVIYVYCFREEDIPEMIELAQNFLKIKIDGAMNSYLARTSMLECLYDFNKVYKDKL